MCRALVIPLLCGGIGHGGKMFSRCTCDLYLYSACRAALRSCVASVASWMKGSLVLRPHSNISYATLSILAHSYRLPSGAIETIADDHISMPLRIRALSNACLMMYILRPCFLCAIYGFSWVGHGSIIGSLPGAERPNILNARSHVLASFQTPLSLNIVSYSRVV